jgi:hypothetical protein
VTRVRRGPSISRGRQPNSRAVLRRGGEVCELLLISSELFHPARRGNRRKAAGAAGTALADGVQGECAVNERDNSPGTVNTAESICDIVLRDGSTLALRPARESDGPAIIRFFEGLSPASL